MLKTELPAPMANTTMIFVCIFLIFWFLKAFRRLARTVLLRRSLIFGNVVQIQGLASYLSFFEEATRAHLNSIVQTRQSKPAVPMSIVYVSCLFESIQLFPTANSDIAILSIKLKATIPGKLYLLTNFNSTAFKKVVHDTCLFQPTATKLGFRDVGVIFRESIFASDSTTSQGLVTLPFLSAQEVCLNEGYEHDIDSTGQYAIYVAIKSPFPSNADDKDVYNISLCFVPDPVLRDTYLKSIFNPNKDGYNNSAGELVDLFEPDDKLHMKTYDSQEGTKGLLSSSSSSSALSLNDEGEITNQTHRTRRKFLIHSSVETMASPGLLKGVYRSVKDSVVNNVFNQQPAMNSVSANSEMVDIEAAVNPSTATGNSNTSNIATESSPAPLHQFPVNEFSNNAAAAIALSFTLPRYLPSVFPTAEINASAPSNIGNVGPVGSTKRVKKDLFPKEVLVVDREGQVYNSMEVFGLGTVAPPQENNSSSPSPSLTSGNNSPLVSSNGAVAAPLPLSSIIQPTSHQSFSSHAELASETMVSHPTRVPPAENIYSSFVSSSSSLIRPLQTSDVSVSELNHVVQSPERDDSGYHTSLGTQQLAHKVVTDDNNALGATSAGASSLALAQGGAYISDECVVCLTDPKEILLLPCRHLCVCASCFVFVDKCPVCRALFDQYVAIQGGTKVKFHSRR